MAILKGTNNQASTLSDENVAGWIITIMMYGPSRRQFLPWVTLLTRNEFLTKSELTTYVINPRQGAQNYQGACISTQTTKPSKRFESP